MFGPLSWLETLFTEGGVCSTPIVCTASQGHSNCSRTDMKEKQRDVCSLCPTVKTVFWLSYTRVLIALNITFQATCTYSANMSCFYRHTKTQSEIYQQSVRAEENEKRFPIRQIQFQPVQSQVSKKSKRSHCLYMLSSYTAVQMFTLAEVLICFSFPREIMVWTGGVLVENVTVEMLFRKLFF